MLASAGRVAVVSKKHCTVTLAPGGRGCAENPVRDLVALVVLEERGLPEALFNPTQK
jgi:hypothetical protein